MADFCYFCKKKIGFFDTSSRTAFAQTVCGNCVNKVNRVAILYNREFSEYTLYSLEDAGKILEKAPSFEMYISRYLKIRAEYEPQIQHYQELAEKEKKTLKKILQKAYLQQNILYQQGCLIQTILQWSF